jgi:hypothetical protein
MARRCFAAALLLVPATVLAQPRLPPHPRLLFDAAGIARLKQRVETALWSTQWARLRRNADQALAEPINLPPRGSNWFHWYVCPTHGARLTTGKRIGPWQWEHVCPVGKEILRGDPTSPKTDFDGCVLSGTHSRYANSVRDLGVLYQVTGEAKYAARAKEILLLYAARYLEYPLHTINNEPKVSGGRVGPQTLDEAVWLIPMAQGADLVWDTLSDADRETIASKLFLPAARDVILPHRMGVHNIQNWKNSAVGLTGLLLGDDALIRAAIDDPDRGYRAQMARGVQADGVWFEGAWGYHFYTLDAVWALVEAARNCGIDLYGDPLRRMFEAPIRLAMPNMKLPAFNDSGEIDIHNELYELALARYREPLLVDGIPPARTSEMALWFGEDRLPPPASPATGSRNFEASGYAILERGATWLCLKYGPSGGGHGHPDKNNFILYSRGDVLFPDPGTRPYGSNLHGEWDRVTLAHNTLVVDGTSQTPATGRILAFGSDHGADYAMTDAGPIYRGVHFVRTAVLLDEKQIVFVDRVEADAQHTYDLALHLAGKWNDVAAGPAPEFPGREGYQHFREVKSTDSAVLSTGRVSVRLAASDPTQTIVATGPGKSTEDRVPIAIFRRKARQTTYVWSVTLDGAPGPLVCQEKDGVVTVETIGRRITVDVSNARVAVAPTEPRP